MGPIYTRTGDGGQTTLLGGQKVWKDSLRVEVCGSLDELNAQLGLARSFGLPESIDALLARIQQELFQMGAELASPEAPNPQCPTLCAEHVQAMERDIDQWEAQLPKIREFIVPTGTPAACQLYLARAVSRRAERRLTTLVRQAGPSTISPVLQAYLNRMGDLLFVLARALNLQANCPEIPWEKPTG